MTQVRDEAWTRVIRWYRQNSSQGSTSFRRHNRQDLEGIGKKEEGIMNYSPLPTRAIDWMQVPFPEVRSSGEAAVGGKVGRVWF